MIKLLIEKTTTQVVDHTSHEGNDWEENQTGHQLYRLLKRWLTRQPYKSLTTQVIDYTSYQGIYWKDHPKGHQNADWKNDHTGCWSHNLSKHQLKGQPHRLLKRDVMSNGKKSWWRLVEIKTLFSFQELNCQCRLLDTSKGKSPTRAGFWLYCKNRTAPNTVCFIAFSYLL